MKYFKAQVLKTGQTRNAFYIEGWHYTLSGFVKQVEKMGFHVITAFALDPNN